MPTYCGTLTSHSSRTGTRCGAMATEMVIANRDSGRIVESDMRSEVILLLVSTYKLGIVSSFNPRLCNSPDPAYRTGFRSEKIEIVGFSQNYIGLKPFRLLFICPRHKCRGYFF